MTALRVTNTLTRAKEPLRPHSRGRVAMYTCGPTTSATSSPPPGAGRRQRTTTRWPTSWGPMRTT